MELRHQFHLHLPVATAWERLTDIERIAACWPGAQLQEIEGDVFRGVLKIKVGPITAQYKGRATLLELDQDARRVVLQASGRDTGGGGQAVATVAATLSADTDGTAVSVVTDLALSGRLASFGRGLLTKMSANLLGQFVACLEQGAPAQAPAPAAAGPVPAAAVTQLGPAQPASEPAVRRVEGPDVAPADLVAAARRSLATRGAAALAAVAALVVVLVVRHRRR